MGTYSGEATPAFSFLPPSKWRSTLHENTFSFRSIWFPLIADLILNGRYVVKGRMAMLSREEWLCCQGKNGYVVKGKMAVLSRGEWLYCQGKNGYVVKGRMAMLSREVNRKSPSCSPL